MKKLLLLLAAMLIFAVSARAADYQIPEELAGDWAKIEQNLALQRDVCYEHCGGDADCLASCDRIYEHNLGNEYNRLMAVKGQAAKAGAGQGGLEYEAPGKDVKCPVCGMFVYKYPDWVAQIVWQDGEHVSFDGAKDMFKYYFALDRYAPGRERSDIGAIYGTEYYDMDIIDAREAWFVLNSDVTGPMGRELLPFKSREDAEAFRKDHGGSAPVRFDEVTPGLVKSLD